MATTDVGGSGGGRPVATVVPIAAFCAIAAAAGVGFFAFPTYPAYDSLYAFLWSREVLDGVRPSFDAYRAPTQHPLLMVVTLPLAPLGDTGLRLFVALCIASFLAIVAGMYRLGFQAAGVLGGLIAAGVVASRLNLSFLAAVGFLDIPYCAFIVWAVVLELERPRRGGAVWALLVLAGLLRPEAWLLAGLYAVHVGLSAGAAVRIRCIALAALAPALWCALDYAVTGDPLFSMTHTDRLAAQLERERDLWQLPELAVKHVNEFLKLPVSLIALAGLALAVCYRRRDLWIVAALVPPTVFSYLVIASGGLATVPRYLLTAALALIVFAAYALAGWTRLVPSSPARRAWAVVAMVFLAGGVAWTATHTDPERIRASLEERERVRLDLRDLVTRPSFKRAAACGSISVPNHKLLPELRWLMDAPDGELLARSDVARGPHRRGAAIIIARRLERRPQWDVGEVPSEAWFVQTPPRGFGLADANRSFAVWARCGPHDAYSDLPEGRKT